MKLSARRPAAAVLALLALVLVAGPFAAKPADAALINQTYDFTVTDFVAIGPNDPLAFTSITGTFTLVFDTASGLISNQPFAFDALSETFGAMAINYNAPNPGRVQIGGVLSGIGGLLVGADDLSMGVTVINPLAPQLDSFIFTDASSEGGIWFADTRIITLSSTTAVPEPGLAALFGLGLLGLGLARKRARR